MAKIIITIVDEEKDNISVEELTSNSFEIKNFNIQDYIELVKKSRESLDFQSVMLVGRYNAIICDKLVNFYCEKNKIDIQQVIL